ncbi:MAG: hypothetical protein ABI444_06415 [Candidatus Kapaibacterium sp.]
MRKHTFSLLGAVMVLSVFYTTNAFAQGSLMVNPKRLILDDRRRNDVLTLYNNGSDTTSYLISLKHFEMRQDGSFKDVDTLPRDYTSADSILRYFPLEVTLAPHESQAIKIRYMKPKDLASGEYRSHLFFQSIERVKSLEAARSDTDKTISLALHAVFGLSIPIIVRNETNSAKVGLDSLMVSAPDTSNKVIVTANLNRTGDESCYGSFIVNHIAKDGKVTELSSLKGLAVYVPLRTRKVAFQFKIPDGVDMTTGTLRLEYQTLTDNPKETTLASAELPLKKG